MDRSSTCALLLPEIERIVPAQEQHRTRGQRDIVQPRIRSVVGGQILINFHTAGIVDKCISMDVPCSAHLIV